MVDKKTFRAEIRAARRKRLEDASSAARATGSRRLAEHLLALPQVRSARCVALFEPLSTEPDVSYITREIEPHIRLLVPALLPDNDLSWHDARTGEDLGRDGIASADVVITPALAIGPHGQRLGQGGGSYDRALPRRRTDTPVIAVVFPDEVDRTFPVESHDEPVDLVVTSEGVRTFTPRTDTAMQASGSG